MLGKLFGPLHALTMYWSTAIRGDRGFEPCPALQFTDEEDESIIRMVQPYTMTSPDRIRALCSSVRYVEKAGITGAIVECGVWRGGSMMAVAHTLMSRGVANRDLYLFDTFEGMTEPGPYDISLHGESAEASLRRSARTEDDRMWCYAPIERVEKALSLTNYPSQFIHFIPGRVEDTLTSSAPERIAILRLDTDWYESTKHELEVLFPRLCQGGVLIIDDYGHCQGARRAVDEYMNRNKIAMHLHDIDYTGRIGMKAFA